MTYPLQNIHEFIESRIDNPIKVSFGELYKLNIEIANIINIIRDNFDYYNGYTSQIEMKGNVFKVAQELSSEYNQLIEDFTKEEPWFDINTYGRGYNSVNPKISSFIEKFIVFRDKLILSPVYPHVIGIVLANNHSNLETKIETTLREVEKKLESANKILNQSINKEYSTYFEKYSNLQRNWSFGWLLFILILIVLVILALFSFLPLNHYPQNITENNALIAYLLPRISIGFTLFYILFFAVKNYRSLKHMQSIYAQKSKSISTYKDYISTIEDKEIRDTVRKEVAKTIFEIHETGYIKENKDKDNLENLNIADIIRAAKSS